MPNKNQSNQKPETKANVQPNQEIENLKIEITKLKKETEEKHNLYLRALADYQNLERRSETERQISTENANRKIALELTHLKDDVDKASEFEKNPALKILKTKIENLFNQFQIKELDLLNKLYNPETAECIEVVKGENDNQIIHVHQKGYTLFGKLLKPARVSVSQKTSLKV